MTKASHIIFTIYMKILWRPILQDRLTKPKLSLLGDQDIIASSPHPTPIPRFDGIAPNKQERTPGHGWLGGAGAARSANHRPGIGAAEMLSCDWTGAAGNHRSQEESQDRLNSKYR